MLVRVREAKQKVRPWAVEYPLVTMRKVGDLLDRADEKVCLWEILKLHSIAAEMKEHKRRDMASLKIQCQYRMYKGRESRAMLKRIADEKQRQLELKSSKDMQRIVRGYVVVVVVVDSFPRSLISSFTHSFIHSFIHSPIHSFTHSFIHSLTHSFVNSFIHSFPHSLIHSLVHSFIRSG